MDSLADSSVEAREAELARIAVNDADLAAALRELLDASHDSAPLFRGTRFAHSASPSTEEMPPRIGPFRLIKHIGKGGMGSVYLAEREHADFVQRVALKLLDSGSSRLAHMASRERRILAALTHPNITAFVDAGTQEGRAWLAMEYVPGETLIDFCRHRGLDVRARVRLFDQVCDAVAHAHAQLVVHRDLKPSNILVDAEGRAKLLDFGIALVLDDGDADAPATRVFTPEYAAPEQLRGDRVTTASDVYSLGLILFELISGRRLSTFERSARDDDWTVSELIRCATTRDDTAVPGHGAAIENKALTQLLGGDLGRIIAHAINPLPARRYASVALLREDLSRWLDFRPLTIHRPDALYVLRRFVRRHRAAVLAASLALMTILGLAATAFWQAREKAQEAATARAALRQSEATREFMSSVFLSADPNQSRGAGTTAGELLAVASKRIDMELSAEPAVAAALLMQIGNVHVSLGDEPAATQALQRALAYNARSPTPSAIIDGGARARLAYYAYSNGNEETARRDLANAIGGLRAAGEEGRADLAIALRMQGNVLFSAHSEDAVKSTSESVRLLESLGRARAWDFLTSLVSLADMLASLGRHEEALSTADRGLADAFVREADGAALRTELHGVRARALTGLKRYGEAEPPLLEVVADSRTRFGPEHANARYWRFRHAELLIAMGRLDDAQATLQTLLDVPASGEQHRLAPVAYAVTAAAVALSRRAEDTSGIIARAQRLACGDDGEPMFCAKTRLLAAESAIRDRRDDVARAALDVCAQDASIRATGTFARRLLVLRARVARDQRDFEAARALLATARGAADLHADEVALLDVEQGYLELAAGDHDAAATALRRGRAQLAGALTVLTPQVREIDAALAAARANR